MADLVQEQIVICGYILHVNM